MTYPYDPELAAAVHLIPKIDFNNIPAARAMADEIAALAPPPDLAGVVVRDVEVPVSGGETITLRITTPSAGERPLPLVYDIHAGGFCCGSLDLVHPRDVILARELAAVTVSVGYRLAPEHPYPVPLEDCYAGLTWIAENASMLGANANRIALLGNSGGGGLAAGLALLARDRGGPHLCFQYLNVPEIDDLLTTDSMNRFDDTPLWNQPNAVLSWRYYLGDLAGRNDVPIYAAAARADDLAGLPPTYIAAMQFDPLRDEGIAYAQRLLAADVPVELHLFPATFHGSNAIADAAISQRELAEEVAVLRRALHG
jgi:acetyl esterase